MNEGRGRLEAVVLAAGEGRTIPLGPIRMVVQEDGTHTRDVLGVAEFEVPPHAATPPPHVHRAHEEVFYVLEGELQFLVGTETVRAQTGAFVMVPIGVRHTFHNVSDRSARFLNTFTPPRYIHYFDELRRLMQADTPPGPEQLAELMSRYDTEVMP